MAVLAEAKHGPEPASGRPPSLWRNRTFLFLLIGQAVSVIGDGFHGVALGLWVLQTTGSATAMATIMSVRIVTTILLGSFAGVVVDRVDRRFLMISMNVIRFGLVSVIAFLMTGGTMSFATLVFLSGLTAVCGNFFGPSFQASLVAVVGKEQLSRATGTLQLTNTIGQVVGPMLGGAVVAATSGAFALTFDAGTFLFSAVMILLGGAFASPRREGQQKRSMWADMREGFSHIRRNPVVLSIMSIAPPLNFFASASMVLLSVIAVKVWKSSPAEYGSLQSAFPFGFALGAAVLMAFSAKIRRRGLWMVSSIALMGFMMLLVPLAPSIWVALPLMFITGVFNSVSNVFLPVIAQSEVPLEIQGRVFGTLGSVVMIANPLSLMISGFLADRFDPVMLGVVFGSCLALTGVGVAILSRPLRTYK